MRLHLAEVAIVTAIAVSARRSRGIGAARRRQNTKDTSSRVVVPGQLAHALVRQSSAGIFSPRAARVRCASQSAAWGSKVARMKVLYDGRATC